MARLTIALLGAPSIDVDGAPLEVDTRKAIALLAYLAVTGDPHRRDALAALFWPEAEAGRARAALRRTLSTLLAALGGRWLVARREVVTLDGNSDIFLDVAEFHRRINQFRARGGPDSQAALTAAVDLYRGDFMAGFSLRDSPAFDDWQLYQAESLQRELAQTLTQLVVRACATGAFDAAVGYARRWLALDLLHEDAHRRLMLAYAWAGERAAALRQYRECVRILDRELGVAPLEATTALYQAIQERREPPPPHMTAAPASTVDRETAVMSNDERLTAHDYPLVGRDHELAAIAAAFAAVGPTGRLVVVKGETGIGKTRLARAFLQQLHERDRPPFSMRCFEGESQLAFGPLIDGMTTALVRPGRASAVAALPGHVLADAARLVPGLTSQRTDLPPAQPLDSPGAQARFFDALIEVLMALVGGEQPGVLFVDDAQWLDASSFELLGYLIRRLGDHPLLLLLTWREERLPDDDRLRRMLADAARAGLATELSLARLTPADVAALACGLGHDSDTNLEPLAARLFDESQGLPFFLIEYLDELREHPPRSGDADAWALPGGVRDLLHARVAATSAAESQVLTTLAAVGRACPFEVLHEASGRSEDETVGALDALLARRLVVESARYVSGRNEPLYDVGHDQLRELVYADMSFARRRLLHRRIAEALRAHSNSPAQVGNHFRLAGQEDKAAAAYLEAGYAAAALYANAEAVDHLQAALALGQLDGVALHERIGDLQTLLGDYERALASYEAAAAQLLPHTSAAIERKLGNLYARLGDWGLAEHHFATAEALLLTDDAIPAPDELAGLYIDWSLTAHRHGGAGRARELGRQALDLAELAGDELALAQSHNLAGILARWAGDLPAARRHLEESLRLSDAQHDAGARAAALNNLALVEQAAGAGERAISCTREALELAIAMGDRHREAALHSNLADVLHAADQSERAQEHLLRSAAIYGEIGVVAGELRPEVWKLAEW